MPKDGRPRSLFDKVWDSHRVADGQDGATLLWIDRHFVHEGSFHGFGMLEKSGRQVARPDLTFGVADHYAPSHARSQPIADPEVAGMMAQLRQNTGRAGIDLFDLDDPRQGIVHVVGPEQGLTLPGLTIVCGDSHTSTHGAFGALGFGIGASEVAHVLATQTLWQRKPAAMRITVNGILSRHVAAKDIILAIIAQIGAAGATGHVIEYTGEAIHALGMEARMTICNMSIEAGARAGMIAPDETTFAWLEGRARAPNPLPLAEWGALASDPDAMFDREVTLDASSIAPTITWGTSPEEALPITGQVPEGPSFAEQRDYMGLAAGTRLDGIAIDRVFIGSCTNGRLSDLRAAATILRGHRAVVPGLVVPGSVAVKRAAEEEGLDRDFIEAGLIWGEPGCSMCVGMNGDLVGPAERCAATSNRNFPGRQGPRARTHLMSPAMAAAAARFGRLVDVRTIA